MNVVHVNQSVVVDQSMWGQIQVSGPDRVRFLQGMCTANIDKLAPGDWVRAMMLTVKGRVVSILEVCHCGDDIVLLCDPLFVDKTIENLEKYAIVDDVVFTRIAKPLYRVWATPKDVWRAEPVWDVANTAFSPEKEVEVRRIEAGMPRYGIDVTEDNFPFETPLNRDVDYEKGCYLGQEPVYRVYSKGSPNKFLRGIRFDGDSAATVGAQVTHSSRAKAGMVTSAAVSPQMGSIALAYLHRSVADPGGEVMVGQQVGTVYELGVF